MKPRIQDYTDPDDVFGEDLNEHQDATVEAHLADSCTDAKPATWTKPADLKSARATGGETRILIHHEIPKDTEVILDQSADWRDAYFDRCWLVAEDTDAKMPGGTAFSATGTPSIGKDTFDGYSGKGCNAGNPPTVVGAGTAGAGQYWNLTTGFLFNFYIYVTQEGKLAAYSKYGSTLYLWGVIGITGDIGGF